MKNLTPDQLEAEFVSDHHNSWDAWKSIAKPFKPRQEVGPVKYVIVEDLGNGMIAVEPIGGGERLVGPLSEFHPG